MKKQFINIVLIIICATCFAQKKDSTLVWLDAIDVKLLGNSSSAIVTPPSSSPQISSKYKDEAFKYEGEISSSQSKLSTAELKMNSAYGKNNNEYNQAKQEAENAKWSKNLAENRLQEAQFNNSIVQSGIASMKQSAADAIAGKLALREKAKKYYLLGDWNNCVANYEDLLLGWEYNSVYGINKDIGFDFYDFMLATRAAKRAADKGLGLKTKKDIFEIVYITSGKAISEIRNSSLTYFEKRYVAMELLNWLTKNVSKIPEKTKSKYNDWFLNVWLGNLSEFSKTSKLADISEYANAISMLAYSLGQKTFYDDMVYPLAHINDANTTVNRYYKIPRFKEDAEAGNSGIAASELLDLQFLLAAYYQEQAGNKPQALEVWLNYLDYANFNWQHKSGALYLSLAIKKSEELKKELGSSALAHTNQNWAIKKQELEDIKKEKEKDVKRKEAGLEWDNEK
ncbi:MAG: hypothetical protein HY841_04520 [Bacteroidetes bacterium]|nr:hypothetical protein [Bacteroidota bacterium]